MTYDSDNFQSSGRKSSGGGLLKGCLIGCGVVCVLGAIVAGIGGFMAFQWGKNATTEDPVVAGGWLQEMVECQIPKGYSPQYGENFTIAGTGLKTIVILPDNVERKKAFQQQMVQPGVTTFIVFSAPGQPEGMVQEMFRSQRPRIGIMKLAANEAKNVTFKSDQVEIVVANGTVKATRSTRTADDQSTIEYSVLIRPDTILFAMGPEKTFDQKAFDAFLKSITVPNAEPKNAAEPKKAADSPKLPAETGS